MRLTKVEIQAYRSLYQVAFEPTDFTVLVGPNNAGKTNLANALEFLGSVCRHGLEVAVSREGGYGNLAFRRRRRTRHPVRFSLCVTLRRSDLRHTVGRLPPLKEVELHYAFTFRASSESRDADFAIDTETLALQLPGEHAKTPIVRIERIGSKVSFRFRRGIRTNAAWSMFLDPLQDKFFQRYIERRIGPTDLMISSLQFNQAVGALLRDVGQTRLFQLTPVECRKPGSPTPNPDLERHGGNLPAVVRYMQRNQETAWRQTLAAMTRILPGLTAIEPAFTTDRRLTLLFTENDATTWTSDEVSDGTIQSLALFTTLFDPRIPLAVIEEPENSVHPWIVRTFVDACRKATDKQVLVTTHSPALISYLRPEDVAVVWRSDLGRTELRRLLEIEPEAEELWSNGKLTVYDLVDGGWIRESVPLGFQ